MNEKILLVDDEEDIRDVLSISLSDLGYEVYTAENGEKAYLTFKEVNPAIILTDIRMPVMDGIELLNKIKKESSDTEVIMVTGHGDMDLAIKSLKLEATDFITKPINEDILEIALKRAHEKISMRRQLKEYTDNLEGLVQEKTERLIKAERVIALGQILEWLPSATKDLIEDVDDGITYFNEMPCLVSIHNRDCEVVATNSLFRERLGDRVGKNSWDVYAEETKSPARCPVGRTLITGKGHRTKETIIGQDGTEIPVIVHTAPIRIEENQVELVLELAADMVEVNRLQEELRNTQQRYQQLFDEVPCYISVLDRDLKIVAANRMFNEAFGKGIGTYCYRTYKHRDDPCVDCPVVMTFQDGGSQQYETVVTSKSGEQINVLVWTAPICDVENNVTHVMEMSTNITQIRMLQDRLTKMGLLLGSISHSVKTLLTGLDGGMYWVESGIENKDEERLLKGQKALRLIIDRVRNLVLNLLYYAKERELNLQDTSVIKFLDNLILTLEPKLEGHTVELKTDFEQELERFEVDRLVLSSALMNVLENAIDACEGDKAKEDHRILFSVKKDNNNIIFEISDNGIGMDQETREKVFTLFFSSKGGRGSGLGLFVSNEMIKQHGGTIEVESFIGSGSKFIVKIPKTFPKGLKRDQSA